VDYAGALAPGNNPLRPSVKTDLPLQICDDIFPERAFRFDGFLDLFMRLVWKLPMQVFYLTGIIDINPDIILFAHILLIICHNEMILWF
jgi:hypothetical protein